MEWQVIDEDTGRLRRKFSNETMRKLKVYIDDKKLKSSTEGYNDVLNREDILVASKRLRSSDEKIEDRKLWRL